MAAKVYIDSSVLVSAFSNEPQQALAMALLQAPHWEQVYVSDWTVAEFNLRAAGQGSARLTAA